MVINGHSLLIAAPIVNMTDEKHRFNGVSYGLAEAGYDIRIKQTLILHPFRKFRIASSVEEFHMPFDLVGVVHDKSTWARRGLSVFNTILEPGWKGFLTLELVYHGWKPLKILAYSGIAQVIFSQTINKSAYVGKYQHQADRPVDAIYEGS